MFVTVLLRSGRLSYSAEDDAAILTYVSKHKSETGGNRLWQEMEKQSVTSHSWQSMKSRYKARLAKSEVVKVATTEEDTKPAESKTKVILPEYACLYFSVEMQLYNRLL